MSAHLYIEGANSKEDQIRCREGFRRLLEKTGFTGRLPRLSACGGKNSAFDDFKTAHRAARPEHFVAMLIDSEGPVADVEKTWPHLKQRDSWDQPAGASDEQVLFMTTSMETWIVVKLFTGSGVFDPMKFMLTLLLWCLLFVLSWPVAMLLLVAWPMVWLLSIPFRLLAGMVEAMLAFIKALLLLPARLLG